MRSARPSLASHTHLAALDLRVVHFSNGALAIFGMRVCNKTKAARLARTGATVLFENDLHIPEATHGLVLLPKFPNLEGWHAKVSDTRMWVGQHNTP